MDFLKFDAVKCTLCGKCIDKCPFGALRILTQVTLKLLPAPTCSRTLVMPFNSLEECADMVPEVLALPFVPAAIEFLERELIDIVERNLGKLLPVKQGEAVLIVMYDASSGQELDSAVEAAAEAALAHGAIDCGDGNIHTEMLRGADMSDEEWKTKEKLEVAIIEQLKKAMLTGDASSPEAAKLARMHADWIRMQWPEGAYSPQAHVCLARGYLADDGFVEYYDSRAGKGATEFLVEAIEAALG